MAGRPTCSMAASASSRVLATVAFGFSRPMRVHRLAEQLAVLGLLDRGALGADQLDAELREHAHVVEGERGVEAGLAAHGGQQRVGALLLDDLRDDLRGDRLDVGGVGHLRVGHDRRRVGVDQDDPVALLAQRLAGLGAGVVELAGLADDDRPRADDQDRADVGSLRHGGLARSARRRGRRRGRGIRPGSANCRGYRGRPRGRKRITRKRAAAPDRQLYRGLSATQICRATPRPRSRASRRRTRANSPAWPRRSTSRRAAPATPAKRRSPAPRPRSPGLRHSPRGMFGSSRLLPPFVKF